MKFEKMLKESAKLASEEWMNSLPDEPAEHEFSERFEWKIRKIKEQKLQLAHPILYQVPKYVACLLLLAILSFSFIFAADVDARNSIVEWFKDKILHIEYEGDGFFSGLHFEPSWIPEGYQFEEMNEMETMTFLYYTNEYGDSISLSYMKGFNSAQVEIDTDETFVRVTIQGYSGYVQIRGKDKNGNTQSNDITWIDTTNNVVFTISGHLDKTELIRMAESVQEQAP